MFDTTPCVRGATPSRRRRAVAAGAMVLLAAAVVRGWSWSDAACACDCPPSLVSWATDWEPAIPADEGVTFQVPWGPALRLAAAGELVLFWLVPMATAAAALGGLVRVRAAAWTALAAFAVQLAFALSPATGPLGLSFREALGGSVALSPAVFGLALAAARFGSPRRADPAPRP